MASRSLNRIILIGNLTRDPELKYTPTGTAVCTFGIATNRSWTTNDGQTKEDVQYHRVVAWQKLAELCGKLLNKGRKVFVEGRMTYRTFTGKDGIQRTIAEIVLDDFIVFGDGRKMTETAPTTSTDEVTATKTTGENKTEENKEEPSKDETVNPDDIPF
ncbi:MAG: single-stranded DNA-binding protein [Candidatus Roizmanbacteria bacterium]|nr:single-stranded DNA-binding protein [Candidatus Roizmanbacteria bacterium]